MAKRFTCSKKTLRQACITFWFYVICIPIIPVLFLLPYLLGGNLEVGPFSLVYLVIILFLLYGAYRSLRILRSLRKSCCVIDGDRVYGISVPDPNLAAIPFDLSGDDIRDIEKTTVSAAWLRTQNALILHTKDRKIVLLALEQTEELERELLSRMESGESNHND